MKKTKCKIHFKCPVLVRMQPPFGFDLNSKCLEKCVLLQFVSIKEFHPRFVGTFRENNCIISKVCHAFFRFFLLDVSEKSRKSLRQIALSNSHSLLTFNKTMATIMGVSLLLILVLTSINYCFAQPSYLSPSHTHKIPGEIWTDRILPFQSFDSRLSFYRTAPNNHPMFHSFPSKKQWHKKHIPYANKLSLINLFNYFNRNVSQKIESVLIGGETSEKEFGHILDGHGYGVRTNSKDTLNKNWMTVYSTSEVNGIKIEIDNSTGLITGLIIQTVNVPSWTALLECSNF